MINCNWNMLTDFAKLLKYEFSRIEDQINDGVAIFGAGFNGVMVSEYLRKEKYNINCFIDNDPAKQQTEIEGIKVCSPQDLPTRGVIFTTPKMFASKLKDDLKTSLPIMTFDAWFAIKNLYKYRELENIFYDNRSCEVLRSILASMLTGSNRYLLDISEKDAFFCLPQFKGNLYESFLDAGAYVGDTLEAFLWSRIGQFEHIYAFEPGKKQFAALTSRVNRLVEEWAINRKKIFLVNAALAESAGITRMNRNEQLSQLRLSMSSGEDEVELTSIDSYLDSRSVTFLKVDVEGAELSLLNGAKKTISQFQPKCALSVYHRPDDLFVISQMCKDLVGEYKFALRHHLPYLMDTVLYCWVD